MLPLQNSGKHHCPRQSHAKPPLQIRNHGDEMYNQLYWGKNSDQIYNKLLNLSIEDDIDSMYSATYNYNPKTKQPSKYVTHQYARQNYLPT